MAVGICRTCLKDLSANLAAEDLVRLYLLELDGRAIAATLCLDDGATVYLYNNGYAERFRKLSPGLMVTWDINLAE